MAEVAIPALALGAMYILSNRKENPEKESFDNVAGPEGKKLVMGELPSGIPTEPVVNYPVQNYADVGTNPASYPAPNAATDRYYRQEVYENQVESGQTPSNSTLFKSLSGDTVQKKDIKFNNMVPFFGSNVTQRTIGFNGNESILDSYGGSGSQVIHKKEQAPLFAPQENLHYAHGVPNHTDFIQSRMNPSRNISNVKPWEEVRVGPGLNKGYTSKGSDGFNAGMEAREMWADKTVDQLRVKTNPKLTFGLGNHEGPANSIIKNRGFEGRVEKYRPDTFYLNTPDRWFTTTGQEKAQRSRAEEPLQPENRPFTTREYFGAATTDQNGASTGGRVEQNYRRSDRPELSPDCKYLGPAHNMNYADGWKNLKQNYGKSGYKSYPNSRTTTKPATEFGIVGGWFKAVTAPVMDILRPSRKENVIGNGRPTGNVGGNYGVDQARVWNPSDRTKTTIREQTEKTYDISQPYYKHGGGYATAQHQPIENQRQTTNCPYVGNSSAAPWAQNGPVYNAAYNAHLNPNKEKLLVNQMNVGVEPLFNGSQNIRVKKFGTTTPAQGPVNMPKESCNIATYGEMGGRNIRGQTVECTRNAPNILSAFNSNPLTKPLNSVA